MKEIKIGNRLIGEGHPIFIIAEIGVNHNGSLEIAKKLVDIAVSAGADAVKFQRRHLEYVYQGEILENPNLGEQSFQYLIPLLKEFELSESDYREIVRMCNEKGIIFMCTPWDNESVDFLEKFAVPAYKIASADMTNLLLLDYVASKQKPVIVSTGMSTYEEIEKTVQFLKARQAEFALLHCNSTYPAPFEDLNLRFMETLRRFEVPIGYSGHERGIAMSTVAAALGACIIERHVTLDRTMVGPDHAASLEPQGLAKLVKNIRQMEEAIGAPTKKLSRGEVLNRELLGKSLVAACDIPKGTLIQKEMLTAKSPGKGISPQRFEELIGQRAVRDIPRDSCFTAEDFGMKQAIVLNHSFRVQWGFKARFHNLAEVVSFKPKFVEFHFSDKDLEYPFVPKKYDQELYIHAPEYYYRSMVDLCSFDEKQRRDSIKIIQRTFDKARELAPYFRGHPKIVLHVGGMSIEPLANTKRLLDNLEASLNQIQMDGVELLLENLPPRPWYFGGQWISNVFADAEEIRDFCLRKNFYMCFDTSHAKLFCNLKGKTLIDYIKVIRPLVRHLHVSDASGVDGEGLQIHEGEIDFEEVFQQFKDQPISLVPEIWRGHQRGGEGFLIAMERLAPYLAVFEKGEE